MDKQTRFILVGLAILVIGLVVKVVIDWSTIDHYAPNPMIEGRMDEQNINDGDSIALKTTAEAPIRVVTTPIETDGCSTWGCYCDESGHWVDKNTNKLDNVECVIRDYDMVKILNIKLSEAETELEDLRQRVTVLSDENIEWKYEAQRTAYLNKILIQDKRPAFVAGDNVILLRGCKPEVSTTDSAYDITTYTVSCDFQP